MLGKLIRLDLRFAYKKYLAMAALLILSGIFLPWIVDLSAAVGLMSVFMVGFLIIAVMSVYLVFESFSQNLFGAEGYLMHTLPVRPWQLVASKTVTTFLWFNLMCAAVVLMGILMGRGDFSIQFGYIGAKEWAAFGDFLLACLKIWVVINLLMFVVVLALYLGIAFASVSLRGRKLGRLCGGAVSFVGIWGVVYLAARVAEWLADVGMASFDSAWWVEGGVFALFAVLYFLLTTYLIGHKLNLR